MELCIEFSETSVEMLTEMLFCGLLFYGEFLGKYNNNDHIGATMSMQESIRGDLKKSMKAKDSARTEAIRILMGEFSREMEKELSDEKVIAIIKKLVKSEKELLAAKQEESSDFLRIMEEYLPRQATEEEIRAWIAAHVDFSQFGNKMQAMRPIMTHFGSAVDGNVVKKVLQGFD